MGIRVYQENRVATYTLDGRELVEDHTVCGGIVTIDGVKVTVYIKGIAVAPGGGFYLTEGTFNGLQGPETLTRYDTDFNILYRIGGVGQGNSQFYGASAVSLDEAGNVYVVEMHNNRVQVFDSNLNFLRKFGRSTLLRSSADYGRTYLPLSANDDGSIWVADYFGYGFLSNYTSNLILHHRVSRFSRDGELLWRHIGRSGLAPNALVVEPDGSAHYVSLSRPLSSRNLLYKMDLERNVLASVGHGEGGAGPGAGVGLARDSQGFIYTYEPYYQQLVKRDGATLAEIDRWSLGAVSAERAMVADSQDFLYVATLIGRAPAYATRIVKSSSDGQAISAFVAEKPVFPTPYSRDILAISPQDVLYLTDTYSRVLQLYDTSGALLASMEAFSKQPQGMAVDGSHLYISFAEAPSYGAIHVYPLLSTGAASISGTMTDAGGNPLEGIKVYAVSDSGLVAGFAVTARDGAYTIEGLAAGGYWVRVAPPEDSPYAPRWYPDGFRLREASVVSAPAQGIDFALPLRPQLAGIASDGWWVGDTLVGIAIRPLTIRWSFSTPPDNYVGADLVITSHRTGETRTIPMELIKLEMGSPLKKTFGKEVTLTEALPDRLRVTVNYRCGRDPQEAIDWLKEEFTSKAMEDLIVYLFGPEAAAAKEQYDKLMEAAQTLDKYIMGQQLAAGWNKYGPGASGNVWDMSINWPADVNIQLTGLLDGVLMRNQMLVYFLDPLPWYMKYWEDRYLRLAVTALYKM